MFYHLYQKVFKETTKRMKTLIIVSLVSVSNKYYSLFKCWRSQPSALERSNSDKSGNTKILRTTLFGVIMSDYYRSKISMTEKNIDTNTSHHVVKVYCDAVHGLSFHIGTIGEGNS